MSTKRTATIDRACQAMLAAFGAWRWDTLRLRRPRVSRVGRVTEAVERLIAAGASLIGEDRLDGTPDYVVMADPEGTSFACFDQGVCPRGRAGRCWVGGRR